MCDQNSCNCRCKFVIFYGKTFVPSYTLTDDVGCLESESDAIELAENLAISHPGVRYFVAEIIGDREIAKNFQRTGRKIKMKPLC